MLGRRGARSGPTLGEPARGRGPSGQARVDTWVTLGAASGTTAGATIGASDGATIDATIDASVGATDSSASGATFDATFDATAVAADRRAVTLLGAIPLSRRAPVSKAFCKGKGTAATFSSTRR